MLGIFGNGRGGVRITRERQFLAALSVGMQLPCRNCSAAFETSTATRSFSCHTAVVLARVTLAKQAKEQEVLVAVVVELRQQGYHPVGLRG
jgi:hypothetical protein